MKTTLKYCEERTGADDLLAVYTDSVLTGIVGISPKLLGGDQGVINRVNNLKNAQELLCLRWQQMKRGCEVTIKELAELVQLCAGCALELGSFLGDFYPNVYDLIDQYGTGYVRNAFSVKERLESAF